jgi:hypothetical protein
MAGEGSTQRKQRSSSRRMEYAISEARLVFKPAMR